MGWKSGATPRHSLSVSSGLMAKGVFPAPFGPATITIRGDAFALLILSPVGGCLPALRKTLITTMSRGSVDLFKGDKGRLHCVQERRGHETQSKGTDMSKTRRIWICIVTLLTIVWLTAGCNTIEGAGKDLEAGGEAIQDAAD